MTDPNHDPPGAKSRGVTILAAVNIVLGVLRIILSGLAVWLLIMFVVDGTTDADLLKLIGFIMLAILWPLLLAIAVISMLVGVLLIVAGMGLRQRRRSSRTLTLVLGALAGLFAMLYAGQFANELADGVPELETASLAVLGMLVHGGYCAFVFVVLLDPKNVKEFDQDITGERPT